MAKPALVYISTDPYRNLTLGVTKDLEVERFVQENRIDRPVNIVYSEEFVTIKEAQCRASLLRKMNKKARARFISRVNPAWRDLIPPQPDHFQRPDDNSAPGDDSGVGSPVPRPPIRPLVAAHAKRWPIDAM